jgi:F0F1-type ATP synthase assembly protein I
VPDPPADRSSIAIALEWSTTIMTIAAEMVVPGLAGYWIDKRLGTKALFLLLGFALGGVLAGFGLARIAKNRSQ